MKNSPSPVQIQRATWAKADNRRIVWRDGVGARRSHAGVLCQGSPHLRWERMANGSVNKPVHIAFNAIMRASPALRPSPTASALTLVLFSIVADETEAPLGLVLGTLGQA
jgi:hypothetical protein